jgi:hypothetical protein
MHSDINYRFIENVLMLDPSSLIQSKIIIIYTLLCLIVPTAPIPLFLNSLNNYQLE